MTLNFGRYEAIYNDLIGSGIVIHAATMLTLKPEWIYFCWGVVGATMVFGKKLTDKLPIPGMGGPCDTNK